MRKVDVVAKAGPEVVIMFNPMWLTTSAPSLNSYFLILVLGLAFTEEELADFEKVPIEK